MRLAALVTVALAGCAASRLDSTNSVAVVGGTVAYDAAATPAQVAVGLPYVARYVAHWAAYAGRPLLVNVVRDGTYPTRGFRDLEHGTATVSYGTDGTVYAAEWEVPLLAQDAPDPATWSWGAWGPLYAGQSPEAVAVTAR